MTGRVVKCLSEKKIEKGRIVMEINGICLRYVQS